MNEHVECKAAREAATRGDYRLFDAVAIRASVLLLSTSPCYCGSRDSIEQDRRSLSEALRAARGGRP